MKREIFRRPTRFTHRFGNEEGMYDPFGGGTFDPKFPVSPTNEPSPQLNIQDHGLHDWRPSKSPVCKPSGAYANINGKPYDLADVQASPIPMSTKKRKSP